MKALWVTDPWETLDHRRDTTLRLIQEALAIGQQAWWCDAAGLRFEGGRVLARCRRVREVAPDRGPGGFRLDPASDLELARFVAVLYRVDPPVDRRYFEHLQLLAAGCGAGGPELVNPVSALLALGDKLGPPALADALPPSVVSSSWEQLEAFGRAERQVVLKPLGGCQSHGVQLLDFRPPAAAQARRAIEAMSDGLARPVLLQRFLPAVYEGERRLWFVDGELLGHVQKRPGEGTFVIDVDKGAACCASELPPADARLAARIGDGLAAEGVRLAAVDVIAGHVTDWNVTSPGMIPMMERVLSRNLARPIVEALARRAAPARPARRTEPALRAVDVA